MSTPIIPKSNKPRISRPLRIKRSIAKNWAALTWPSHGYKIVKRANLLWTINRHHAIERSFGVFGSFEDVQLTFLFEQMKQRGCDIFFDIGANFGLYSLCCAQFGVAKEIHAFEPDPRNYAQMQGHLYLNKMTEKIKLHSLALSDKENELEFSIFSDGCSGITKVVENDDEQRAEALNSLNQETRKLQASTLDILFPLKEKKLFLKIDVEGHEQSTIRGAEKLLRRNNCVLQIEIWPEHFDVIMEQLAALGYQPFHQIDVDYYFKKK